MKRFFLAALAIAAIASCTKNEVNEIVGDNQITFQTVVGPSTKALIDATTYATTDPTFGTVAYYNATGETFPTNSKPYIPESEVTYQTSFWSTVTPYYWPKNGFLTFFSYSPWSINESVSCSETDGITISNYDVSAAQGVDIMVADVKTEMKSNGTNGGYNGVPTIFRHKLSQLVDVQFKTDKEYNKADGIAGSPYVAGDKLFFVNYVKVNNLEQTGTYVSGNNVDDTHLGTWSLPTTPAYDHDYAWYTETSSCEKEFTSTAVSAKTMSYILMVPQTYKAPVAPQTAADVSNVEIKYTIRTYSGSGASAYSDDVVTTTISMYDIFGTQTEPDYTLNMNKKVTLTFTVSVDQIKWAPSVEAWGTETISAPTIN